MTLADINGVWKWCNELVVPLFQGSFSYTWKGFVKVYAYWGSDSAYITGRVSLIDLTNSAKCMNGTSFQFLLH